ncbi:MAG TPA: hypothetical protein VM778_07630, partial [Gemmatimonadota bacterium]|nr:hypothetical protein [Gemmatimonadota bacterium]
MTIAWDVPSFAALGIGAAAWVAWLALAPPGWRDPFRSGLRVAAAGLLALALVDAGCRRADAGGRTLAVRVDRSLSMDVAGETGPTRAEAAAAWLASDAFEEWSAGWNVERDSFGGATTDPATAVEAAAAELPDAILVVSDGRAAGGRSPEPPPGPLYVVVPGPTVLADAAVLELRVDEPTGGALVARVEVAAVGGRPTAARRIEVTVDGRPVGRADVPPMAPGERRTVRVPLPAATAGERVVEARLEPADPVTANDGRAWIWRPGAGPARALLVGLRPGWEMAAWRRALERAHPGPVDARWTAGGALRPTAGGAPQGWSALDPAHYRLVIVVGDPAAAGPEGAAWL